MSTTVDTANPANERQARMLDAQGNRRHHQTDDPELRLLKHIDKVFEELHPAERRGMIDCIRQFLAELEEEIEEEVCD